MARSSVVRVDCPHCGRTLCEVPRPGIEPGSFRRGALLTRELAGASAVPEGAPVRALDDRRVLDLNHDEDLLVACYQRSCGWLWAVDRGALDRALDGAGRTLIVGVDVPARRIRALRTARSA